MQQSLSGYLIVKEKVENKGFTVPKTHIGQSKFAEVIGVPKNSIYNPKDIVVHQEAIGYYNAPDLGGDYFYVKEKDINGIVKGNSVYATRDLVYLEVQENSKHSLKIGDITLSIDPEYNQFHKDIVTPFGVVHSVPLVATDSYSYGEVFLHVDIKEGDIVYAMHFLVHEDNKVFINDKVFYTQRYEECYCRIRDGVVKMLNQYNFIEPIVEENFKIGNFSLRNDDKTNERKGKIQYICDELKQQGANIGDIIYFSKDSDYGVDFLGKDLFRIHNLYILAKENKETMELEALDDNIIVKQFPPETELSGGFVIPESSRFTPNKGTVVSKGKNVDEIVVGDVVHFEGQFGLMLEREDGLYRILKKKHCFSKEKN